jgi:uncharacterized protein (DUF1501 family)
MATTRRQFIKRSAQFVGLSVVLPKVWLTNAHAQAQLADPNRRILVVIQLLGGNDGLNTVVPYTDSRYYSLRPTLALKESGLKDSQGRSTVISNAFALNPNLEKIKEIYDQNKVAIVQGVGYPNPSGSHWESMDIWQTANESGKGRGWLGRYADQTVTDPSALTTVAIGSGSALPRSLSADRVVTPNLIPTALDAFDFETDLQFPSNRANRLDVFKSNVSRNFPAESFSGSIARSGLVTINNVERIKAAASGFASSVTYPQNELLASSLKLAAQIITAIPEANLLYVPWGFFDYHSDQPRFQPQYLKQYSEAVRAFYDDLTQRGLADNTVILQWSEFGRRPEENSSAGTDHGAASSIFIMGNPVRGGLYGQQPSLAATQLDSTGNMKFTVDFRSVYATILDKWLGADSQSILGAKFEDLGFLA